MDNAFGAVDFEAGSTSDVGYSHDTEPMVIAWDAKEAEALRVYVPVSPVVPVGCAVMTVLAGMPAPVTVMPIPITVFAVMEVTVSVVPLPDAVAPGVVDVEAEQKAT